MRPYTDRQLSIILSAHAAGQLCRGGRMNFGLGIIPYLGARFPGSQARAGG